jgi:two-component system chemotaxis response regulator CheB
LPSTPGAGYHAPVEPGASIHAERFHHEEHDMSPAVTGPSRLVFEAVAIGASAGGVSALTSVVETLPATFPAAVLIVLHLDPRRRSQLAGLLARHSRLPVKEAEFAEPVRPGQIYTAPPDAHLLVTDRRVALTHSKLVHFARPSIDLLFESVADTYGSSAIGVILTGSGVDGAVGTEMIKQRGGVTIVQDPDAAEYRWMPQAALVTGAVDFVLPLADIGPALVDMVGTGSLAAATKASVKR